MTRRGWILIVFIIIVEVITIGIYQRYSPSPPGRRTAYMVQRGDTLWSIASRLYPNQHTGKMVDAIRRASGLEGARGPVLKVGQVLSIPDPM